MSAKPQNSRDLTNLADHFGALRSRTRFFVRGAEDYAREAGNKEPLQRAADDLLEYFDEFAGFIESLHRGEPVPNECGEVEGD